MRTAIRALEGLPQASMGEALVAAASEAWRDQLGFDPDEEPEGREARERHAALSTLLTLVAELAGSPGSDPARVASRDAVLLELTVRAADEAQGDVDGVELLTLHRAKGLEWDAVFIPSLEEGLLPVSQAGDDEEALAEERRLLYVGITRARRYLALSWAQRRPTATGRLQARTMSRFLRPLDGVAQRSSVVRSRRAAQSTHRDGSMPRRDGVDAELLGALKVWRRRRSSEDGVPAYVVATDATLAAIAERRPGSDAELLSVPGIGSAQGCQVRWRDPRRRRSELVMGGAAALDDTHLDAVARLCEAAAGASGGLVSDAQHAAVAIAGGCTWVTRPADFARFGPRGLRWQHLVLG